MEAPKFLLSFLFLFSILVAVHKGVRASDPNHYRHLHPEERHNGFRPTKLFVFGDAYADTGNVQMPMGANPWKTPYGMTFPGNPTGRYSNGRVLTDYIAEFYGFDSPLPYRCIKNEPNRLHCGVNFAYGGTGVFKTFSSEPNMTTQIDFFEKLLNDCVYNKSDLESSLFLLVNAGNDYGVYTAKGGTDEDLPDFVKQVTGQLGLNLKRLQQLGARKIAVATLQPLGCLPRNTIVSLFKKCNVTENFTAYLHNQMLNQTVIELNNECDDGSSIVILDIHSSFTTIFENNGDLSGDFKFKTPLNPCCKGISGRYSCGNLNGKGEKMYTLCDNVESAFFWDRAHPTHAGWHAVLTTLKTTLTQIS